MKMSDERCATRPGAPAPAREERIRTALSVSPRRSREIEREIEQKMSHERCATRPGAPAPADEERIRTALSVSPRRSREIEQGA